MAITLEIPEALYKRLQKHAVPFVDTPLSVIEKWADHFEHAQNGKTASTAELPTVEYGAKKLDPLRPPISFTLGRLGTFGSTRFSNWNDLVRIAHIAAFKQAGSFEQLRNVTHAQIDKGERSDSGYKFVSEIGSPFKASMRITPGSMPYGLRNTSSSRFAPPSSGGTIRRLRIRVRQGFWNSSREPLSYACK